MSEKQLTKAELLLMINELRKRVEALETKQIEKSKVIVSGSSPRAQAYYSAFKDGGR
jgi:hypothetical protein